MRNVVRYFVMTVVSLAMASSALAQRDAGSKVRGEYNFYGGSAGRSMRGAREYTHDYRQYVQAAPAQKVSPEVAKEAADSIGHYIAKAQKHMAWMRKQAAGDKESLASLDVIDKNLADAAKHHKEMHEICMKENVDAEGSMKCCQKIDDSLKTAIDEHDKLMKRLAGDKAALKK